MISDYSLQEFLAAEAALEKAWGDKGDGRSALAQAEQLKMRIDIGADMLASAAPDKRAVIAKQVDTLRAALARALADPADRRRCEAWRAAYARWDAAYFQVQLEIGDECEPKPSETPTPLSCQTPTLI